MFPKEGSHCHIHLSRQFSWSRIWLLRLFCQEWPRINRQLSCSGFFITTAIEGGAVPSNRRQFLAICADAVGS
jgi:hypothetical protein